MPYKFESCATLRQS